MVIKMSCEIKVKRRRLSAPIFIYSGASTLVITDKGNHTQVAKMSNPFELIVD